MNAEKPRSYEGLAWVALCLLVWGLAVRALTVAEPMPYWSVDPWLLFSPPVGLTPAMGFACDAAMFFALMAVCPWVGSRRFGYPFIGIALALPAWGAIWWHVAKSPDALEQARVGSAWAGAIAGGLAAWTLAQDPKYRKILVGLGVGMVFALSAKGVVQVFVEHPMTVESYEANPEATLQAQGWAPGSPQALAYERRLRQPEATTWFGLSNVAASFAAFGLVTLAGAAWHARRAVNIASVLAFGALASGVLLVLTGSKGGYGAAAIGFALLLGAPLLRRLGPRFGGIAAFGALALVLLAIVVRGRLGTEIGELSVLFRWFYIDAATRIALDHPLLGVGPAGFKDAYLLAKNPLSPEEVSSPHSILFDWWATLGVAGLVLGGLLLTAVWRIGRSIAQPPSEEDASSEPPIDWRVLLLIALVPTAIAATLEAPMATVESALVRLVGLAGWVAIAWVWTRHPCRLVLGAGVAALVAHAQLEMTLSNTHAVAWAAVLIGAACAQFAQLPLTSRRKLSRVHLLPWLLGVVVILMYCGVISMAVIWEASLRIAATPIKQELLERERTGTLDLGLHHTSAKYVSWELSDALGPWPDHYQTIRALSRVELELARITDARGTDPAPHFERVEELNARLIERLPESAKAWAWSGVAARAIAEIGPEPETWLRVAAERWERAAELDPHGLIHAVRLSDAYAELGESASASEWAARALAIDEKLYLDPLRQLSDRDRARIERRLLNPPPP